MSTEPLDIVLNLIGKETSELTGGNQTPRKSGNLMNNPRYSLNPSGSSPVQPDPAPVPMPFPQPTVAVGNITVTSEIAGEILIDGHSTGTRIKSGGTVSITNISAGYTEVAVKEDDGTITKTPNLIMVEQGKTVSATIHIPTIIDVPPPTTASVVPYGYPRLGEAVKQASQHIIENIPANATVAFLSIETSDAEVSEFVIGEIAYHQMVLSRKFRVVDRNSINIVMQENSMQISSAIDDKLALAIGKMLRASVVITGSITGTGLTRRLRVMALDVQTSEILATSSEPV
jgi:hypothetical protein